MTGHSIWTKSILTWFKLTAPAQGTVFVCQLASPHTCTQTQTHIAHTSSSLAIRPCDSIKQLSGLFSVTNSWMPAFQWDSISWIQCRLSQTRTEKAADYSTSSHLYMQRYSSISEGVWLLLSGARIMKTEVDRAWRSAAFIMPVSSEV